MRCAILAMGLHMVIVAPHVNSLYCPRNSKRQISAGWATGIVRLCGGFPKFVLAIMVA